ncbi:MAG: endolytic transglycosylase MltG [Acidobacteriota bacterium]|nr:endolytic transglycosylase MltG [Acidobacteriota bacterium]MDE3043380.1 endolytic transglycosylase MltG [Acidobacteriota bacterium]MDE3107580.1 endolytic transglycosylase MltG [Acidobacteriota bacterium]MDE3222121.1 endolytic transglycosylase MltG [Acidobacteriota bacterium]
MASLVTKPVGRVLGVAAVLVLVALGWFALQVDPVFAGKGREVVVTVHPGDSLATIAGELHGAGVIASPLAFRVDALIFGAPVVLPGSYQLRQGSSFSTVRAILRGGPNVVALTASPGLTLHEMAVTLAGDLGNVYASAFLKDATTIDVHSPFARNQSLEGLVGAGTYVVRPGETPRELAQKMANAFVREAAAAGLTPSTTLDGLSAYQLVIAASIVEKEGYYPKNMPRVARVIFNRLRRGGPLQMDATVLYALGRDGGTVTSAMLRTPSPYNSYLNSGLTPTPICTVSPTALAAVLHAPPGSWLYFVVVDRAGDEAFATTFAQQLANERLAASRGLS